MAPVLPYDPDLMMVGFRDPNLAPVNFAHLQPVITSNEFGMEPMVPKIGFTTLVNP